MHEGRAAVALASKLVGTEWEAQYTSSYGTCGIMDGSRVSQVDLST